MQNNNILNNQFISYPKSKNHIISWTKKDKIKTCDVNSNCSEIEFNITLNKFNNNKLFNNIKNNEVYKIDNYSNIDDNYINSNINSNKNSDKNSKKYDIIIFFLIFILLIFFIFKIKNNYFQNN